MRILAVNPWVYDFTYYDLYAKPYGLMLLATQLSKMGHHINFVDLCWTEAYDPRFAQKRKKDGTGAFYREEIELPMPYRVFKRRYYRFGLPPHYAKMLFLELEKPDLILVTSGMTYWYLGVKDTIEFIKGIFPNVPIYLGGIYATLLPEHASRTSGAHFVVTGSSHNFFKLLIQKDVNLPMFPELELFYNRLYYLPLLTSFGCPFRCDYCGSQTIYGGQLKAFDPLEAYDYIEKYSDIYKTNIVAFYDDALLYKKESHLYRFLEKVIKEGSKFRFYTPNGLHVRFIDDRCAEMLREGGFEKVRLSLEFVENRGYDNKTTLQEFERALAYLHKAGYKQEEIGVYLLCGIENQSWEEVKKGIDYVYERGAVVYLSEYSPVPTSKIFSENMKRCKYDLNEPLFHNNSILPMEHEGFTYNDFLELKRYNRQKRNQISKNKDDDDKRTN